MPLARLFLAEKKENNLLIGDCGISEDQAALLIVHRTV